MLVTFLILVAALVYFVDKVKKAKTVPIRRVSGLDALDECIGRATEMGRPVHYTMGEQNIEAQTFAAFEILRYVATQCATYETSLIVTNRKAEMHPITEELVRQAYIGAGKADSYRPDNIRFLTDNQNAYAAGCLAIMESEKVAANLMFGPFAAESLILAEGGNRVGAIQIAGTSYTSQLPFFVAACDYTLIGEEMFAAGAYLSRDNIILGSLLMEDLGKALSVLLILIGTVLMTIGNKSIDSLLKM